jgi:hypothetical protein
VGDGIESGFLDDAVRIDDGDSFLDKRQREEREMCP